MISIILARLGSAFTLLKGGNSKVSKMGDASSGTAVWAMVQVDQRKPDKRSEGRTKEWQHYVDNGAWDPSPGSHGGLFIAINLFYVKVGYKSVMRCSTRLSRYATNTTVRNVHLRAAN